MSLEMLDRTFQFSAAYHHLGQKTDPATRPPRSLTFKKEGIKKEELELQMCGK